MVLRDFDFFVDISWLWVYEGLWGNNIYELMLKSFLWTYALISSFSSLSVCWLEFHRTLRTRNSSTTLWHKIDQFDEDEKHPPLFTMNLSKQHSCIHKISTYHLPPVSRRRWNSETRELHPSPLCRSIVELNFMLCLKNAVKRQQQTAWGKKKLFVVDSKRRKKRKTVERKITERQMLHNELKAASVRIKASRRQTQ